MANKAKKPSKSFTNKVHKIVKSNIFTSVAIASILANILLIIGYLVLTSTNTFNFSVYNVVRDQYCKNIDGLIERAEEVGSSNQALKEWRVTCVSEEFAPYYSEAIKKFEASTKE